MRRGQSGWYEEDGVGEWTTVAAAVDWKYGVICGAPFQDGRFRLVILSLRCFVSVEKNECTVDCKLRGDEDEAGRASAVCFESEVDQLVTAVPMMRANYLVSW